MTERAQSTTIFRLATAPASLIGRFRPDLTAAVRADESTYAGGRAALFLLLLLVGLGYTVAAQVFHGTVGYLAREVDPFAYVFRPFFWVLFPESLLYMTAVAGIGAFSPALGVLLVAAFIPADLLAASAAANGQLAPLPAAVAARAISYALLWILAVEIPILVRRSQPGGGSALRSIAWRAVATAVLVAMWANLVPWLVRPTMTWTGLLQVYDEVSQPLWQFWWILAIGGALVAGMAAFVGRGAGSSGYATQEPDRAVAQPPSVMRDWIWVLVLGGLFAGFYADIAQAVIIIGTLALTLPVLSMLLPRVPAPRPLRGGSLRVRFALAIVASAAIGWAFTSVVSGMVEMDALLAGPIIIAISAPIFRIIVEWGWRAPTGPARPSAAVTSVTSGLVVTLVGLTWLALPAMALAGDCPDDTGWYCMAKWATAAPLMAAAVGAILAGAALWRYLGYGHEPPPPPTPIDQSRADSMPPPPGPPPEAKQFGLPQHGSPAPFQAGDSSSDSGGKGASGAGDDDAPNYNFFGNKKP